MGARLSDGATDRRIERLAAEPDGVPKVGAYRRDASDRDEAGAEATNSEAIGEDDLVPPRNVQSRALGPRDKHKHLCDGTALKCSRRTASAADVSTVRKAS